MSDYTTDPPPEPASLFLTNGKYPELFGFVLGAAGKSTDEALLSSDKS